MFSKETITLKRSDNRFQIKEGQPCVIGGLLRKVLCISQTEISRSSNDYNGLVDAYQERKVIIATCTDKRGISVEVKFPLNRLFYNTFNLRSDYGRSITLKVKAQTPGVSPSTRISVSSERVKELFSQNDHSNAQPSK